MENTLGVFDEDLFVIRSYSPITTLGGGKVLTTLDIKNLPFKSWVPLLENDPIMRFNQLVKYSSPKVIEEWSSITQIHIDKIFEWIQILGLSITKRRIIYTEERKHNSVNDVLEIIENYHEKNPLRRGMGIDLLKQQSKFDELWFFEIISIIEKDGTVKKIESEYALSSHSLELNAETNDLNKRIEKIIVQNGFAPITTKDISEQLNLSEKKCLELLHVLKNQKIIIKVKMNLWMHTENKDKLFLVNKNHFQLNDELDISAFKSYTGLTRKFAIPVLEFCDQQGWTSRMGNVRIKGEKI